MKRIVFLFAMFLSIISLPVMAGVKDNTQNRFEYVHDPRLNPEAMKDIVENEDAVYGFSPDPQSKSIGEYADYDWTDEKFVAGAKEERKAYHESLESMTDILYKMRDEGASTEEMARAVSAERNRLRLAAYKDNPEGLAEVKKRNLDVYGHEDGPTPDEMYEKYGSWTTVIQKSFSTNMGMDACCGLYDEYYPLYIELGYVENMRKMETAADADEWIGIFLGDDPGSLEGSWEMTSQMDAAAAMLGGIEGMASSLSKLGDVVEIGSAYEGELLGYKTFFVPCIFSSMSVDLVLTTKDGAIAGLTTGVYSGGKEESGEDTGTEDYDSFDLALPVPSFEGELPGTLTIPKGEGAFPAVVLIQGSGSSDRDETVANLKPFRDLAEGLAKKGVAVYRFDKRSYVYGTQMMSDKSITLEDESIEDAVNAVQLLAKQEKIDPDRIFVLGHSLGGNAIPAIYQELEQEKVKACGFIMMAASPRPLDELMREQYNYLYSLMPEVTKEQLDEKDQVFAELDKLQDLDSLSDEDTVLGVYSSYWKWLAQYDILDAAQKITVPCLLLQGEEDYQVTMEDYGIWQEALGEKNNWKMISYPGLTHTFTPGEKTEGAEVYSRAAKVDEQVIEDIAEFINCCGIREREE